MMQEDAYMSELYNPQLKKLLIEVVERQLRDNDPPITSITYQRLLAAGHSPNTAKEKIAVAVVGQIWNAMHEGKPFDLAKYTAELNRIK